MNQLNKRRISYMILGVLIVAASLFFTNSKVGIAVSILLALTAFLDEKLPILYLLIFIPIRPFLIVCNHGYKWIGIFIICILLIRIIVLNRNNIKTLFTFRYFELAFFAFCFFGTAIAFKNGVAIAAIIMQLHTFLLYYLMFFIIVRMNITKEDVFLFISTTFIVGTLMSIQGIIEKLSLRMWLLPHAWVNMKLAPTNWIRVYGLIGGPNEFALYLLISFILSLYLLRFAKGRYKLSLYIGLVLTQTTFWLTYSRGAVLILIVFIPAYLILNKRFPNFKKIVAITLVSLLLFFMVGKATNYIAGTNLGAKRFTEAFSKETLFMSSKDGRIFYVKKAVEILHDKPVTGYGFATFGSAATQTYSSPIYKKYGIKWNFYSDDQYIEILAETGLIGFILILIFGYGISSNLLKYRKRSLVSPFVLYLLTALIVGGLVYNILENDVFMLYFFILLGILARSQTNKPNDEQSSTFFI
jgi:putative inorganic carbon (hco3(-)) transporter